MATATTTAASMFEGEYISRTRRFKSILAEKWLSKLLTPAIVFFLAASFLAGSPTVTSGLIALLAAVISFVIEAAAFAYTGEDWKWKEAK